MSPLVTALNALIGFQFFRIWVFAVLVTLDMFAFRQKCTDSGLGGLFTLFFFFRYTIAVCLAWRLFVGLGGALALFCARSHLASWVGFSKRLNVHCRFSVCSICKALLRTRSCVSVDFFFDFFFGYSRLFFSGLSYMIIFVLRSSSACKPPSPYISKRIYM